MSKYKYKKTMKHLPEHLGDMITELHLSELTLDQRKTQYLEWCDETGHIPMDDEIESLAVGLA